MGAYLAAYMAQFLANLATGSRWNGHPWDETPEKYEDLPGGQLMGPWLAVAAVIGVMLLFFTAVAVIWVLVDNAQLANSGV